MIELAAMMPVYNEAAQYLEQTLEHLDKLVEAIVIWDDGSTDNTGEICQSFKKVKYHRSDERLFTQNESLLRSRLWNLTIQLKPQWILALDADENFEERAEAEFRSLLKQQDFQAVDFRLFDFWNGFQCRVDGGWNPWIKFNRMLVKYDPSLSDQWCQEDLHCGRFPLEYYNIPYAFQSDLRIKHFGWMKIEDRQRKYDFYTNKRPKCQHAQSIFSDEVQLEDWIPCKTLPFKV
ncbi:glycosyltransferase [Candidatus Contubernalis alkaliaceticus]|uniref:glycosyltransferase n=1 Tax=Candidatus Contubernalis alkaliaceticus TaxID=338645 RepID=UPI001F4BFC8D|nr:glycosyltransferase [Candidatus Contubernalis alkalaceticus]UNC91156.1 glycosyltransferase family 2 protein [Candidatus Contubernalis alkalaceticus]